MDFERYGSDCMEHDGVVETEFGRLRRLDPPFRRGRHRDSKCFSSYYS